MSSTVHSKTRAIDSAVSHYRHPVLFYALATAIPWALWLTAGALSRQAATPASEIAVTTLGLVGLAAPVGVAAAMVARDPWLRRDTLHRLVNVRDAPAWVWILSVVLMPGALLVATTLSIGLGYPIEQFLLRGGASFTTGLVPAVVTLTLAPLLEELAWHSYGTDALASRWSVWKTSIVFAFLWAIWHIPLATIEGNYQSEVVENGALATFTFLGSVFPFVILMNWLYYRGGRNIWVAVVFHLVHGVRDERAGDARGHRPDPGDERGLRITLQQCRVGHHEVDAHRHVSSRRLPGEPLDEGVVHHLPARPGLAHRSRGIGGGAERSEAGHPLSERQQRGEVRHRVGRRAQRHPALADRPLIHRRRTGRGALRGRVERRGHRADHAGRTPPGPERAAGVARAAGLLGPLLGRRPHLLRARPRLQRHGTSCRCAVRQ